MSATTKGIWFEENRNRYRVRLYKNGKVAHRSYHNTYEAAESALRDALRTRHTAEPEQPRTTLPLTLDNLLILAG